MLVWPTAAAGAGDYSTASTTIDSQDLGFAARQYLSLLSSEGHYYHHQSQCGGELRELRVLDDGVGHSPGHQLGVHPGLGAELCRRDLLDRGVQDGGHDRLATEGDC